jgi:hypothetical protein
MRAGWSSFKNQLRIGDALSGDRRSYGRLFHSSSGKWSFRYIYEVAFDSSQLEKIGPIMEPECRDSYVRWLKGRGLDTILEYDTR